MVDVVMVLVSLTVGVSAGLYTGEGGVRSVILRVLLVLALFQLWGFWMLVDMIW